jgi:mono/diheme cytochrome c family protein
VLKPLRLGALLASLVLAGALAEARTTPSPAARPGSAAQAATRPTPRHHLAMTWGVPAPYASARNPLPRTEKVLRMGGAVYAKYCESCHGAQGLGDGPESRHLAPPPGNLASLAELPIEQRDPYIYWTIAEGGVAFGTAMPGFRHTLTGDQIWAVTSYIEARLPRKNR